MKPERPEYKNKPRKCPKCGSKRVATILYGMPIFSEELEEKMAAGKIVLGGCCQLIDDPKWQCADCETGIWKKRDESMDL